MPLNTEAQQYIDTLAEAGLPPFETIPLDMQREIFDAVNPDAPPMPEVHEVVDRVVPGAGGDIPIRIHRSSDASDQPAIVYYHGGGWVIGTLDSHEPICRALANAAGATVIAVDYRRAPEDLYPAAFDDCAAVTAWVAENAAELRIDASRVAVAGDSAGGNLAAAVSLWARDNGLSLAAQVLFYPATNLVDPETDSYRSNGEGYLLSAAWMSWFIEQYVPDEAQRGDAHASPALAETHVGLPAAYVTTAEFDPLRDDGKAYADTLAAAGVDVVYRNFEGAIHGFASQVGTFEDAAVVIDDVGAFLTERW